MPRNECPECEGHGYVRGTEVWGKEPSDGEYTWEIMDAQECEHCDGDGIDPDSKVHCDECSHSYVDDGEDECPECGAARCYETLCSVKVHTARKTYYGGKTREIRVGDRYRRTVTGGYYANGPRWMDVSRSLVQKGPAWEERV